VTVTEKEAEFYNTQPKAKEGLLDKLIIQVEKRNFHSEIQASTIKSPSCYSSWYRIPTESWNLSVFLKNMSKTKIPSLRPVLLVSAYFLSNNRSCYSLLTDSI
jgi:hypothetical protein